MRILHVITTLGRGGAEMQLLMMTRHQVHRGGHHVTVRYLKGKGELAASFEENGVTVVHPRESSPFHPCALMRLFHFLRRHKTDVVHTHLLKANFVGGIAAKFAGVKCIVSHKHNDEEFLRKRRYALLHDLASRFSDDVVIYLSEHVKNFFNKFEVVRPNSPLVVYYGFAPGVYSASPVRLRDMFRIPRSAYVFGTVARIAPQKGIDVLIEAFNQVAASCPDVHLVVVGGKGFDAGYYERVMEQARFSPVSERIHFTGQLENPRGAYDEFDCFVLASRWEGFGLVLLEAMSAGCPIVATRVSAIPEVLRDGRDGMLVNGEDADALAAALASKAEVGKEPRLINRERLNHFSEGANFGEIEAVYKRYARP